MPKRLGSADPPMSCQRRFEASRVEQQLWSEAYEYLVPERRQPLARGESTVLCGKESTRGVSPTSDSEEGKCA